MAAIEQLPTCFHVSKMAATQSQERDADLSSLAEDFDQWQKANIVPILTITNIPTRFR